MIKRREAVTRRKAVRRKLGVSETNRPSSLVKLKTLTLVAHAKDEGRRERVRERDVGGEGG